MSGLVLAGLLLGAVWGIVADRIAARWPAHEDGSVRPVGLRTVAVVATGALAFAALAGRWPEPAALVPLWAWAAVLVVLLATDLDQRLLPDRLTLPLIPIAAVALVAGLDPLLAGKELALVSGLAAALAAPAFLLVTDRLVGGGLGMGDVKLAVSLGLVCGASRLLAGFLAASVAFGLVVLVLLVTRRVGLRTAIPFGPVLIIGALAGATLP